MIRSLFSGISGLKGHQIHMDAVGHNISNVNTTGFKASCVTFADTLYQTTAGESAPQGNLGGINPKQIDLEANVASIDTVFGDASVQGTGKNTDVVLAGNGLFMVKNNSGIYYTRSGAFEFDVNGNYVMSGNGSFVQGWMARENGELVTTEQPGNITIKAGKSMQPQMTISATYLNNLNTDTKGYEIASIVAKFADGTQKAVPNYSSGSIGEITLGLKDAGGVVHDVKLDENAEYKFTTGDDVKGKALFGTKVTALESAGTDKEVTVTYQGDKQKVYDIKMEDPLHPGKYIPFQIKHTTGTHAIGHKLGIEGTIDPKGVTTHGPEPGYTVLTVTLTKPPSMAGKKVQIKTPLPLTGLDCSLDKGQARKPLLL